MQSPAGVSADSWPVYRPAPEAVTDKPAAETPTEEKKGFWGSVFNLVMFVVGSVALYFMLRTTSWAEMRDVLYRIGWIGGIVLALDLIALCLDAAAWHAFMRPEARMVKYWRVLGAWASGRAINVLTPFGALGEATKVTMLLNHAPKARLISALVLLNVAMLYLSVAVMLIGIPVTILLVDLPDAIKVTVGIGLAVLVPAMVGLGFLIQRGATVTLVGMLRKTRLVSDARAKDWKQRLAEVDKHIRELHSNRTAGTRAGFAYVLISQAVTYTSTFLLIWAVGVDLTAPLMLAVVSVGLLIQWIASIVPLRLGLEDGGNYAMYSLLGATGEHGLFVTMLNRGRSFSVAILGLGVMAIMSGLERLQRRKIKQRIAELRDQQNVAG